MSNMFTIKPAQAKPPIVEAIVIQVTTKILDVINPAKTMKIV